MNGARSQRLPLSLSGKHPDDAPCEGAIGNRLRSGFVTQVHAQPEQSRVWIEGIVMQATILALDDEMEAGSIAQ